MKQTIQPPSPRQPLETVSVMSDLATLESLLEAARSPLLENVAEGMALPVDEELKSGADDTQKESKNENVQSVTRNSTISVETQHLLSKIELMLKGSKVAIVHPLGMQSQTGEVMGSQANGKSPSPLADDENSASTESAQQGTGNSSRIAKTQRPLPKIDHILQPNMATLPSFKGSKKHTYPDNLTLSREAHPWPGLLLLAEAAQEMQFQSGENRPWPGLLLLAEAAQKVESEQGSNTAEGGESSG